MRSGFLRRPSALAVLLLSAQASLPAQSAVHFSLEETRRVNVLDSFPLATGARWVYENTYASDEGNPPRRVQMRWVKQVAVSGHHQVPEGIVIHLEERHDPADYEFGPGWSEADKTKRQQRPPPNAQRHYLVHGNCLFEVHERGWDAASESLTAPFLEQLRGGALTPAYCFPMAVNLWWAERNREQAGLQELIAFRQGRGGVSFSGAYFWIVDAKEDIETPYGVIENAYQLRYQSLGGPLLRWFKEGLGLVRERSSHGGTYIETDSVLKEFHPGGAP